MVKRVFTAVTAVLLVFSLCLPVFAHEVPDTGRQDCSITVTMHLGSQRVGGGSLQLYRVGDISCDDGNYFFVPSEKFQDCEESFADVTSSELAQALAKLAQKQTPMKTQSIDKDGVACFKDLTPGLYLVIQNKAASGYQKAKPFLVSVPMYNQNTQKYDYDVDASPKVAIKKETTPTQSGTTQPKPPKLPQSGQVNWPVPVLLMVGLSMMLAGWLLRRGQRSSEDKK